MYNVLIKGSCGLASKSADHFK